MPGDRILLPADALRRVGLSIVSIIVERTRQGQGVDGRLKPYSTRPFARPLGGIPSRTISALGEGLQRFTTKQGALWAIITGGYAAYKKARYPQDSGGVNMTATGGMLRSMTVAAVDEATGKIVIGFSRDDAAELAYYHNVSGAGRGRTIRRFMGLTAEEEIRVARIAGEAFRTNL